MVMVNDPKKLKRELIESQTALEILRKFETTREK